MDWFEDNNEFIIVTDWSPEYVDLFDYLTSRNPLDECCARRIFKQVRWEEILRYTYTVGRDETGWDRFYEWVRLDSRTFMQEFLLLMKFYRSRWYWNFQYRLFQIVEAIAYCHGRGIFHRDIKDENVLINVKTGHIKLIDFGSGAFVEDEYTDYQGTKVYSPPEWVRYQRYSGWSLESWCLGVLLFIIISGEIPFETEEDILRCTPTLKRRRISLGKTRFF